MNIFFTGAVRGGRRDQPQYATIVKSLAKYGIVLSKHVADETLPQFGESALSYREILERELRTLSQCDIVVAEVTLPTHGVGYLIARATALGKRVVALHQGDYSLKLTGILQGDPLVEVHRYDSDKDLEIILSDSLGTLV
jgi:2'-deoxynucleoside 5'-phosphate N-hydrolase